MAGFWVGTAAKWVFFCLGVRLYLHPTSLGPPSPYGPLGAGVDVIINVGEQAMISFKTLGMM